MPTVWTVVLVIHLIGMVGMVATAGVQLARYPLGPLKRLKWAWLPTVCTTMAAGLLLMLVAAAAGIDYDLGKALTKLAVAALSLWVAMRYHAVEREQTPPWVPGSLAVFVAAEIALSAAWH